MQLPIYDIVINIDDESTAMTCVSLVQEPAVERNFECFSKKLRFAADNEKRCITGVAIRAGVPIYRWSQELGDYYVRFTKETIEKMVFKYSKMNLWNSVSLEHSGKLIDSAVMVEFFIKSPEKCPKGFEDIEDGSLMVTYKITDEELWNTIRDTDQFNGFSIEVYADLKPTGEQVPTDFFSSLMQWLKEGEKKKPASIELSSKSQIISAIEKRHPLLIDEGGEEAAEWWPHSVGSRAGRDIVVLYNPETGKWKVEDIKGLDAVTSKDEIGEFDYGDSSYEDIMDDEEVVVSETGHSSSFSDLIHNKVFCMISYNDEKEDPATGYRQCAIIAHGYTHAGNECIRIMEVYGASRSVREGEGMIPDYRLLLTKRIQALKPMYGTAQWGWDVLDSRVNLSGDKSMSPCIDHITEEDLSK